MTANVCTEYQTHDDDDDDNTDALTKIHKNNKYFIQLMKYNIHV